MYIIQKIIVAALFPLHSIAKSIRAHYYLPPTY